MDLAERPLPGSTRLIWSNICKRGAGCGELMNCHKMAAEGFIGFSQMW
jgi:hypothetical protein